MASNKEFMIAKLRKLLIASRAYAPGDTIDAVMTKYAMTCDTTRMNETNGIAWSPLASTIYEVVAALSSGIEDAILWVDYDMKRKEECDMPISDAGIDWLSESSQIAGQAKNYVRTKYVSASDISRTQLCAYAATLGGLPLTKIEIQTRDGVKLGRTTVRPHDYSQRIVDDEVLRMWFAAAMDEHEKRGEITSTITQSEDSLSSMNQQSTFFTEEVVLRPAQCEALKVIEKQNNGVRRRIRMAAGSGKTLVGIETMKRRGGLWCVLAPSIVLVEQWGGTLSAMNIPWINGCEMDELPQSDGKALLVVVCTYASAYKLDSRGQSSEGEKSDGEVLRDNSDGKGMSEMDDLTSDDVGSLDEDETEESGENLEDNSSGDEEDDSISLLDDNSETDSVISEDDSSKEFISFEGFQGVIVDEAHHIEEHEGTIHGRIWRGIVDMETRGRGKDVLCLSASLRRFEGDEEEENKGERSKDEFTFEWSLREAINAGDLVDYSVVVPVWKGDPSLGDIARFIGTDERFTTVLVYCNTIASCKVMVEHLNAMGQTACWVSGDEPKGERMKKMDEFTRGEYRFLVSVQVLSEGVNFVNADTCVLAEPRHSPISITQCVGRVLRRGKGKKRSWVVVPSGWIEGERSRPVVSLMRVLSGEDDDLVKKNGKKCGRLEYEIGVRREKNSEKVESETTRDENELLRVEVYRGDMLSILEKNSWMQSVIALVDWWILRGKGKPKQRSKDIEEKKVAHTHKNLREKKRQGNLSAEVISYLDKNISGWDYVSTIAEQYSALIEFYENNSRFPIATEIDSAGKKVGEQFASIRAVHKKNKLSQEKKIFLDSQLPDWDKRRTIGDLYSSLIEFYERNKRFPMKTKKSGTERKLGKQLNDIRVSHKKDKLSQEKKTFLDSHLPGWDSVETLDTQYCALIEFYKINKRLPMMTKKSDDEYKLGEQLKRIRQSYKRNKLPQETIAYLTEHLSSKWLPDEKRARKIDTEAVTKKMKERYALLINYKGDRPLKPTKDPYSGNLLSAIRDDFSKKVSWVIPENVAFLDQTIVWWRPRTATKPKE